MIRSVGLRSAQSLRGRAHQIRNGRRMSPPVARCHLDKARAREVRPPRRRCGRDPASMRLLDSRAMARRLAVIVNPTKPAASLAAAIDRVVASADGASRILICGSLYLAGLVLAENG